MSHVGSDGNESDPIPWDVPWNEHHWSPTNAIKTTACHCTSSERERSRRIFKHFMSIHPQKSKASIRSHRLLLPTKCILQRAIPSVEKPRSIRLIDLPPNILNLILQLVYNDEERSRDLCHCSRPRTLYKTVKYVALEHRIVNTMNLRSVCRAFYMWAHHNILRSDADVGLEVDFSDLEALQTKFYWMRGADVVKKLADDFPGIAETGAIIYLGNPGRQRNIKTVVSMLLEAKQNIFSGVTFWDLDYYFRDEIVELIDKVAHAAAIGLRNNNQNFDTAPAIKLLEEVYVEDELRFLTLLKYLQCRPLSKLHIPETLIPSFFSQDESRFTIDDLANACQTIVFREFYDYYQVTDRWLWAHYKEYYLHFFDPTLHDQGDLSLGQAFKQIYSQISVMQLNNRRWEMFMTAVKSPKWLNSSNIEFRRLGIRNNSAYQPSWSGITYSGVKRLCGMLSSVQRVEIIGGKSVERVEDERAFRVGAILKDLLPFAPTLTTLVYRPNDSDPLHLYRFPHIESMDPNHPCVLLSRFSKLQILDIEIRLCFELFRQSSYINKMDIPLHRDWNLRVKKRTGHCHSEELPEDFQGFVDSKPAHTWTAPLIITLLQDCRDWRDKYEEIAGKKLFWDVKIHIKKYKEARAPWTSIQWEIIFMPLRRPPMVQLTLSKVPNLRLISNVLEELNDEWFEKWSYDELHMESEIFDNGFVDIG